MLKTAASFTRAFVVAVSIATPICAQESTTDNSAQNELNNTRQNTGVKVAGRSTSSAFRPIGTPHVTPLSRPTLTPPPRPTSFANWNTSPRETATADQNVKVAAASHVTAGDATAGGVRRTAFMQSGEGYGMPNMDAAPITRPEAAAIHQIPRTPVDNTTRGQDPQMPPGLNNVPPLQGGAASQNLPPSLQPGNAYGGTGGAGLTAPPASPSDRSPVAQPSMSSSSQWSTVDNCNLVSPPSTYVATSWGCGQPMVYPASYPYSVVPATTMPNTPAALAVYNNDPGYRPLISLGQENYNVQLGRGILGQPVAYVPGQYVRNFLRYIFP